MLRLALIGCGRVAERGHVGGIRPLLGKEIEVVAVSDVSEERRNLIGDALGAPAKARYADYRDVLKREDVDVVDLPLPHQLHEEIIVAAARARKGVISEKPLTTDMASAKRIATTVREAGIRFFVMHNDNYNPVYRGMRDAVVAGRIGKPFLYRNEHGGTGVYEGHGKDPLWRTRMAVAGGGHVIDGSYHAIYTTEGLMQSPVVSVASSMGTYGNDWDVEDTSVMVLNHASGGITLMFASQAIPGKAAAVDELYGAAGAIRISRGDPPAEIFENAVGEWKPLPKAVVAPGFAGCFEVAVEVMKGGSRPEFSLEAAIHNLAIVMAAYRAAKEKRVVPVAELEGEAK